MPGAAKRNLEKNSRNIDPMLTFFPRDLLFEMPMIPLSTKRDHFAPLFRSACYSRQIEDRNLTLSINISWSMNNARLNAGRDLMSCVHYAHVKETGTTRSESTHLFHIISDPIKTYFKICDPNIRCDCF